MSIISDPTYKQYLTSIKHRITQAQIKAMLSVNKELLHLYRHIGVYILEVQEQSERWDKIVQQLASDLKEAFPWMTGLSRTNLMNMRRFASSYTDTEIVQQAVGQIPWSHNILLLEKCSTKKERFWYAQQAVENGRSRNMMSIHIERNLFQTQWKAITNFATTLPKPTSDLAQNILKDPYNFDFLTLSTEAKEKEIEDALIKKITHFLLELGAGFAYMGRQFNLKVWQEDFYLDLLFYHAKLHCYVVIELKTTKFKPEYAGKLWFYQAAIDWEIKSPEDNPTIGILLCRSKDEVTAQYALENLKRPVWVSEYVLEETLPEELKNKLPSTKEIEESLNRINEEK